MIFNNICYLYFTGFQIADIKQSSPLQLKGSIPCFLSVKMSAHAANRTMRVLQFHFTHCTYFLTSIYCCEVVPHLNRFSFAAALIALSCLCPTKLAYVFNRRRSKSSKQTSFSAGKHECTVDAHAHIYRPLGAYYLKCHHLICAIYIVGLIPCQVMVVGN